MNDSVIKHIPKSHIQYSAKNKINFCGSAFVEDSEDLPASPQTRAVYVKFEHGAFTKWHMHTGVQILLVERGIGFVEQKDCPPFDIVQGDRICIPEKVWHRHGAKKGEMMIHLAITTGDTDWDYDDPCE